MHFYSSEASSRPNFHKAVIYSYANGTSSVMRCNHHHIAHFLYLLLGFSVSIAWILVSMISKVSGVMLLTPMVTKRSQCSHGTALQRPSGTPNDQAAVGTQRHALSRGFPEGCPLQMRMSLHIRQKPERLWHGWVHQ